MAFVIAEPCVDNMDQSCVAVCPVDCISAEPGVDRKFHIDPDGCINCGSCLTACPNSAIYPAEQLPTQWANYAWVDAAWFRDAEASRAVLRQLLAEPAA
jgi:NAD-dependent dihydropyrimidine dehydrogenase PreA subunit